MKIVSKKISDLTPAPYNPRQSTQKQEASLKASLSKFGLVEPIIYNKQTNNIVGGHFRVRELIKLGIKEVDCVLVDLSPEDEKELNIRLNANVGEWDWEMISSDWDSQKLDDWGMDVPVFHDTIKSNDINLNEYNKVHILLSFHPDNFKEIERELNQIRNNSNIEYEQTAN